MTRYISLYRWKNRSALKRGGGEVPLVLDELEECIAGEDSVEKEYLQKELQIGNLQFRRSVKGTMDELEQMAEWRHIPVSIQSGEEYL